MNTSVFFAYTYGDYFVILLISWRYW